MPLDNIGLIIIDEDMMCYKQESSPYYTRRCDQTIRYLIKQNDLDQQPSLTTYAQSKQSSIEYYQLNKRYNNISMPKVHIV